MTYGHGVYRVSLTAAGVAFGLLFALAPAEAQSAILTVHDAWVREPLGGRDATSVYVTVENSGAVPRAIVAAATDAADRVELHDLKTDGSMMRMSPVKQIGDYVVGKVALPEQFGAASVPVVSTGRTMAVGRTRGRRGEHVRERGSTHRAPARR